MFRRAIAFLACCLCSLVSAAPRPNIIFLLADDIGYGDFGCYGATKVKTPNCDRLATQGLRFTDAHAPSAVCTPTRYAFLTGEYAWRKQGTGILPGNAGLIIEPGRVTVPALLKQAGYTTGVVGKWHLGLGTTPTDYNTDVKPGPLELGFDYAWLLPATGDRVPCVWVENHRVVNLDPADPIKAKKNPPDGPQPQLYRLDTDLGETNDVAAQHPEKVREMSSLLDGLRAKPQSRPSAVPAPAN